MIKASDVMHYFEILSLKDFNIWLNQNCDNISLEIKEALPYLLGKNYIVSVNL